MLPSLVPFLKFIDAEEKVRSRNFVLKVRSLIQIITEMLKYT